MCGEGNEIYCNLCVFLAVDLGIATVICSVHHFSPHTTILTEYILLQIQMSMSSKDQICPVQNFKMHYIDFHDVLHRNSQWMKPSDYVYYLLSCFQKYAAAFNT